jgi:protein-disulfide isomerase
MASRTKQKEEARARRLAEEQARQERERNQRRLRMLSGVVLAAIAVVAVAIAVSTGGGGGTSTTGLQTGAKETATVNAVQKLLNGIPQNGAVLGNPKAPVTMTYYGDFECPVCQDFTLNGGWPQLVQNEVRQGKVKVVYRAFQTATRDPNTFQTQQAAGLAAGQQQKFWDYMELFYHQQGAEDSGYVTESFLDGLAKQIPGLNFNAWKTARSSQALLAQVQADGAASNAAGVSGTPTLIFKGPKGQASPSTGVPSYSDLLKAISQVS